MVAHSLLNNFNNVQLSFEWLLRFDSMFYKIHILKETIVVSRHPCENNEPTFDHLRMMCARLGLLAHGRTVYLHYEATNAEIHKK